MRGLGLRVIVMSALAASCLASPVGAGAAGNVQHYVVFIEASGQFYASYGEDRFEPGAANGRFGVDGYEGGSWFWRVRAAASSAPRSPLVSTSANFIAGGTHAAPLIDWSVNNGNLSEKNLCGAPGELDQVYSESRPTAVGDSEWISAPPGTVRFNGRWFTVAYPPRYELFDTCYHGMPGGGVSGLRFYHPIAAGEAPVPDGAFKKGKPYKLEIYDEYFRGPEHVSDPPQAHTEAGGAFLSIEARPIGEKTWEAVNRRYRKTADGRIFTG